mmetsp:Transcript_64233/g.178413  ORF Transcript_64233/g.178413 Transcript_64233/m.178413 type:complete len:231 (-) Transcript_64233:91-783(-)
MRIVLMSASKSSAASFTHSRVIWPSFSPFWGPSCPVIHSCLNWPVVKPFSRRRFTMSSSRTCSEKHSVRCDASAAMICTWADTTEDAREALRNDVFQSGGDASCGSISWRTFCKYSRTFTREMKTNSINCGQSIVFMLISMLSRPSRAGESQKFSSKTPLSKTPPLLTSVCAATLPATPTTSNRTTLEVLVCPPRLRPRVATVVANVAAWTEHAAAADAMVGADAEELPP